MPTVIHELADAFLRRKQALAERGQAKTKLAGSDYFMPKSAKEDLNNRLSVFEQGGLPELLKQAGKEMYDNPIVNTAIGFSPVLGDIQAAGETMSALERGAPWQETAGYAVGMLPFIPMVGKTVWHGSPHKFDAFDISKIGSGEGSQAFGHGLYLAETPETAKQYQAMANNPAKRQGGLTGEGRDQAVLDSLIKLNAKKYTEGDVNKLAELVAQRPAAFTNPEKMIERIGQYEGNAAPSYLYKVDLPDEQIAKMLDWDKPLSEQSETIQNALSQYSKNYENPEKALRDFLGTDYAKEFPNVRDVKWAKEILNNPDYDVAIDGKAWLDSQMRAGVGSSFYNLLGSKNAGQIYERMAQDLGGANLASQKLYEAGIPGIQYLDQGSRGAGEGTRNYVVFSDEIPKILERNGTSVFEFPKD